MGRQRAFAQPGSQSRAQRRDLGHDGLQKWHRQCCMRSRFMSSAVLRRAADRKHWRGLPTCVTAGLLITGVFSQWPLKSFPWQSVPVLRDRLLWRYSSGEDNAVPEVLRRRSSDRDLREGIGECWSLSCPNLQSSIAAWCGRIRECRPCHRRGSRTAQRPTRSGAILADMANLESARASR